MAVASGSNVRRAALRRLPLVAVLLVGFWLWKGGGGMFPTQREIIWELGKDRASIRAVDIQIDDGTGKLIMRHQVSWDHGPPSGQIVQNARLAQGDYPARVFIKREADRPEAPLGLILHVGGEETVVVALDAR